MSFYAGRTVEQIRLRLVNSVSVSNLLSETTRLSPKRRGAEFVIAWTQLVDTAGFYSVFLRPMSNLFSGVSFSQVVLYKAHPVIPHLERATVIAQIPKLAMFGRQNTETFGLSYHSASLHLLLPLHSSPIRCSSIMTTGSFCDTAGPMTSFNIQVLWIRGRGRVGNEGAQSRQVRERGFIIQTLLRPAPATALHIPSQPVK